MKRQRAFNEGVRLCGCDEGNVKVLKAEQWAGSCVMQCINEVRGKFWCSFSNPGGCSVEVGTINK